MFGPRILLLWLLAVFISATSTASTENEYQQNKCANINATIHTIATSTSAKKQQNYYPATIIPTERTATTAIVSKKVHVYLLYFSHFVRFPSLPLLSFFGAKRKICMFICVSTFFSFASTSYYYTKQNLVTNCKKNHITFSKANNIDVLLQLTLLTNILDYMSKKFVLLN